MKSKIRTLLEAAKTNVRIPEHDLIEAVSALGSGTSADPYIAIYLLGLAGDASMASVVEPYLQHPPEPMVSRVALQVLVRHWELGGRYADAIRAAIVGHRWDEDRMVRGTAIALAGASLRQAWSPALATELLKVTASADLIERDVALTSAREAVMGASWFELPPMERLRVPSGAEAEELLNKLRTRVGLS